MRGAKDDMMADSAYLSKIHVSDACRILKDAVPRDFMYGHQHLCHIKSEIMKQYDRHPVVELRASRGRLRDRKHIAENGGDAPELTAICTEQAILGAQNDVSVVYPECFVTLESG
jgi:hypothetical protein